MEYDYLSNLCLSFEEVEGDYLSTGARALGDYLSTLPHVTEERRPLIKTSRSFIVDRGNYTHRVIVGKLMDEHGLVWIAGDGFPYRIKEEDGKTITFLPPLVFKSSKKDARNLPPHQLRAKMTKQSLIVLRGHLVKAGCRDEDVYSDLDEWINSDLNMVFQRYEEVKARGIDLLSMSLEDLTSPDFNHICKCRGKKHADMWSMEKLNTSIDECATCNCAQCQGHRRKSTY